MFLMEDSALLSWLFAEKNETKRNNQRKPFVTPGLVYNYVRGEICNGVVFFSLKTSHSFWYMLYYIYVSIFKGKINMKSKLFRHRSLLSYQPLLFKILEADSDSKESVE